MTKAFLAVSGNTAAASAGVRDKVRSADRSRGAGARSAAIRPGAPSISRTSRTRSSSRSCAPGEHQVARSYVLYREERARERAKRVQEAAEARAPAIHVMVGGAKERSTPRSSRR
jgi:ribonucleoside-diphosphate reductase alpha chain